MPHHLNIGQNHYIKIGNRIFKIVVTLKYLGMTLTNQNLFFKFKECLLPLNSKPFVFPSVF
jgi:hypothetical protein